ncbi:hypothetical protein RN001_013707 [Aquatica leii]|uniref:MADF domain-containing protein n=1 Tax=Aquatica leii TaxID=1421715 RepID=A0AAN7P0E4_9COLE|nr:hypothetical protein RN001_013707 [Aquatica leii]
MSEQAKILFSVAEDEKLVDKVSQFPCLYDLASPVYKNQTVKDNTCKEIAEYLERSVEDCKKRLRNIKDTYQKRQRKEKGTTGRSGSTKSKPWALADMLAFLGAAEHKRETKTNITIQDNDIMPSLDKTSVDKNVSTKTVNDTQASQTIENSVEPIQNCSSWRSPIKRQRHNDNIIQMMEMRSKERQEIVRSLQAKEDDIDLFFKSIALSVKKLRPDLINDAKLMSDGVPIGSPQ